ncbi:MAG TPA: TlpA disulfide reductase family protein [Thermoanaerobaculia bacterium]|jgi:thiol-disulfide isomerase/thioredoxin|nr:TlpA disulfide reductase family protein [Thermoanaerobaculia bacterium]
MKLPNPLSLPSRRLTLVAALAGSLLLLSCGDGSSASSAPAAKTTSFRMQTVDGRTLSPKDFGGQVVVVDFWATWCLPCRLQAEILEPVYRDYKGRGVQFLAANVGEEKDVVKQFLKGKPFPYPVLLDPKQSVATDLGVLALPTLLVIDKKGKVAYFQSGVADGDTLRQLIKQAGA